LIEIWRVGERLIERRRVTKRFIQMRRKVGEWVICGIIVVNS